MAGDHAGGRVCWTDRLHGSGQARLVESQATAEPAIPTDAVDVEVECLDRVHRDKEGDGRVLTHAGRGRVPLDLLGHIICDRSEERRVGKECSFEWWSG